LGGFHIATVPNTTRFLKLNNHLNNNQDEKTIENQCHFGHFNGNFSKPEGQMLRSLAVSYLENIKFSIHDVNNSKFIKYVFFDVKFYFDNVHTIFQVCHPKKNVCKNDINRG
jgi:hypothetical protein